MNHISPNLHDFVTRLATLLIISSFYIKRKEKLPIAFVTMADTGALISIKNIDTDYFSRYQNTFFLFDPLSSACHSSIPAYKYTR